MKEFLTEITLCPITVCVGNPADDISNLWHSYIEACSAYDYKLIKGKYGSLFFCDTFFNNHSNYSRRKIDVLSTYIKAGEKEKTFEIIAEKHAIKTNSAEVKIFFFVFFIIQPLLKR